MMIAYHQMNAKWTDVVASDKVVGSIFLVGDELFGVEKLTIGVIDFVDDGGFEIDEDGVRDMLVESGGHRIF